MDIIILLCEGRGFVCGLGGTSWLKNTNKNSLKFLLVQETGNNSVSPKI